MILVLFFLLCRKLGLSRTAANLATFLLAFEDMTFVQASEAMLDVYFVNFMMLCFLLYLHRRYLLSGLTLGLSAISKLYGAFAGPVLLIHRLLSKANRSPRFALTLVIAPLSTLVLLSLLEYVITCRIENPVVRLREMLTLSGSLTFANTTHPALSRPWEWIVSYRTMAYWYTPHYTAAKSPTVWVMIIPAVGYLVWRAIRGCEAGLFGISWFL